MSRLLLRRRPHSNLFLVPKVWSVSTYACRGRWFHGCGSVLLDVHHDSSASSSLASNHHDDDRSITIGDVHVSDPPRGSGRPDLVPSLNEADSQYLGAISSSSSSSTTLAHLRWLLQKDLALRQDFLLTGPPALARDRRHVLLLYAALTEREVEYVALSRDTNDADLKQRKEVVVGTTATPTETTSEASSNSMSSSSIYWNQAPVRAALNGRLLILDGLEKAERNVLPTLNNLLENRELSLDDGGLLVAPQVYEQQQQYDQNDNNSTSAATTVQVHPVHPDFRVAALASLPAHLDPPLRSRFQARMVRAMDTGEMLQALAAMMIQEPLANHRRALDVDQLRQLCQFAAQIPDGISLQSVCDAANYWAQTPNDFMSSPARAALLPYSVQMMSVADVNPEKIGSVLTRSLDHQTQPQQPSTFIETQTTRSVLALMHAAFESGSRFVALVGPKGCYKSALARHFLRLSDENDNQQQQQQQTQLFSLYSDMTARDLLLARGTDGEGNTVWHATPLTRAITNGHAVILDGIDKLSSDTLSSLAILMEQGFCDLPDGTRVQANENFKCIALAHPPHEDGNDWMVPEVRGALHSIRVDPLPSSELKQVLLGLYPSIDPHTVDKVVDLRNRLESANSSGAADTQEEQESLILSLRKMKHICMRLAQQKKDGGADGENLARLVHNALLTSLMPEREEKIVKRCMRDAGIIIPKKQKKKKRKTTTQSSSIEFEQLLESCRRTPEHPLLVPDPVFEENPGHGQVLHDILEAHSVGERALLVMGFQGVGKNKICDYLLHRLQCEREYVQLHRDTTVQSFLSTPSVENGRIVYGDSPLVRAAKYGRILVVDEADKAPVEVVALLKGLIEDGELALPNGRVLRYSNDPDMNQDPNDTEEDEVLSIHSDFRIWALANPAGYPFHGNDLAREMADVFSCHTVPPLDAVSQKRILKRYGPDVPDTMIQSLVHIWQDLREAHEKGLMAYPFSVREAVSVVRHLNKFPRDGIDGAVENVIAFDRLDNVVLKQLAAVFARHGVPVSINVKSDPSPHEATAGGVSTPRTRSSRPKHGKIDEKNDPHVGGNTWAGGSGGSDTAGLGGRGGPYRLDSGHPVHQVSEEMKAQVSEEAQREAKAMAKEALAKKLEELNIGQLDWERYKTIHSHVELQIQQLQVLLKDIRRRKEERIWLKRQSTGELDDSRLVDALAGEKDVFKRRGKPNDNDHRSSHGEEPIVIKVLVDVSASMYRFNGYDGRLQRLLEATLMLMESLKEDKRFQLNIIGHSGDSAEIPLVSGDTPHDPKTQLRVLETMVAHSQYCFSGDSTLEAIELAVSQANEGDLILVISDANLERYHIDPEDVSALMQKKGVHSHLVLIAGFGEEPIQLAQAIPNERAQVCLDSSELPLIIKNIIASAAK